MALDIRISCSGFASVDLEGRLLLCLNKNNLANGKRIYSPLGGALHFHESARPFLEGIGAAFENQSDLRLRLPWKNVPEFYAWFMTRKQRETSCYRELAEELVDEEHALPDLPPEAVTLKLVGFAEDITRSHRKDQQGVPTVRYVEIFRAAFAPKYEETLRAALSYPHTHLALVDPGAIARSRTAEGTSIATVCRRLLAIPYQNQA